MLARFGPQPWLTPQKQAGYIEAWSQPGALTGMLNWYRATPAGGAEGRARRSTWPRCRSSTRRSSGAHAAPGDLGHGRSGTAAGDARHAADYCDDLMVREIDGADHWVVHQKTAEVIGASCAIFSVLLSKAALDASARERTGHHCRRRGRRAARPPLAGRACRSAAVVAAAHEQGHAAALTRWAAAGLGTAALEQVLIYCAERAAKADRGHLPGVPAAHREARRPALSTTSSPAMPRSASRNPPCASPAPGSDGGRGRRAWSTSPRPGRARSTGSGRAACCASCATASAAPVRPARRPRRPAIRRSLILVRPQLADNIGMVARAMANFGLEHLRLVDPRDGWPNEKARIAASGANFIIDGAEVFPSFERRWRGSTGCARPPRASAIWPSRS